MKNAVAARREIERRDRTPVVTKLILALVFLLGVGVILAGITGMREYSASGFSSESGYSAIHALSGEVSSAWEKKLQPQLAQVGADQRAALNAAVKTLTGHRMPLETGNAFTVIPSFFIAFKGR